MLCIHSKKMIMIKVVSKVVHVIVRVSCVLGSDFQLMTSWVLQQPSNQEPSLRLALSGITHTR